LVLLPGRGSERVAAAAARAGLTDYVTIEDGWPERLAASLEDVRQFDAGGTLPDRRFRRMVQSQLSYGLYVVEPGGRVLTWNEDAAAITSYEPGEMIGGEYGALFSEADRAAGVAAELLGTAVRSGTADYEGWRPTRDGEDVYVDEQLVAVEGGDGEPVLVGAILQDHTCPVRGELSPRRSGGRND
jgi:PAS domain S-box-containing protein